MTWYMLLASRIKDRGGSVFLYRSPDLLRMGIPASPIDGQLCQ